MLSQVAEINFCKVENYIYIILDEFDFLYLFIHCCNLGCSIKIQFEVRKCEAFSFVRLSGIV